MANETILDGFTFLTDVTNNLTIFNVDFFLNPMLVVLSMLIISRDTNKWKVLLLPLTALWHILGFQPHIIWYVFVSIIFGTELLTTGIIGSLASVIIEKSRKIPAIARSTVKLGISAGQTAKRAGTFANILRKGEYNTKIKGRVFEAGSKPKGIGTILDKDGRPIGTMLDKGKKPKQVESLIQFEKRPLDKKLLQKAYKQSKLNEDIKKAKGNIMSLLGESTKTKTKTKDWVTKKEWLARMERDADKKRLEKLKRLKK